MANADHLDRLRQGVDAWNAWRKKESKVRPDLRQADLPGADLSDADLRRADLGAAYLVGANLYDAKLRWANLSSADLGAAYLVGANLYDAKLRWANLSSADLSRAGLGTADLNGARLNGAKLSYAYLDSADLSEANLSGADLSKADLRQANLVDATLDHADITGAQLWETQRAGWSIKGIVCARAFWDREGEEQTEYREGEFERLFAEKPRIMLRYVGGISNVELFALPLIVQRLEAEHPGSALRIRPLGAGRRQRCRSDDYCRRSGGPRHRRIRAGA